MQSQNIERQDQNPQKQLNQAVQANKVEKEAPVPSVFLQQYLQLINYNSLEKNQQPKEHWLDSPIIKKSDHQFVNCVTFMDCIFQHQGQLLRLKYKYGWFEATLNILLLPFQSEHHQVPDLENGGFAKVYKMSCLGKKVVIKCFHFKKQNFLFAFKQVLKEYMIFVLGDYYGFGPKINHKYFNIIIYQNCIEFQMECCKQLGQLDEIDAQEIQFQLKVALRKMHALKIVHFDIKPSNICYSEITKKYVFIDFGLSEMIESQIGFEVWMSYRGSLGYCYEEMRQSFAKNYAVVSVDPFYNDAFGLNKTLTQISLLKTDLNFFLSRQLLQFNSQLNISSKLKYQLWISYFQLTPSRFYAYHQSVIQNFQLLNQKKYTQEVIFMIKEMNFNWMAKRNITKILASKNELEQTSQDSIHINSLPYSFEEEQNQILLSLKNQVIFDETYYQDERFEVISKNSNHPKYKQYWLSYFQLNGVYSNLQLCFLQASEILQLGSLLFSFQEKETISKSILKNTDKSFKQAHRYIPQAIFAIFSYALENIQAQGAWKIIHNLMFSVIFLELIPQPKIMQLMLLLIIQARMSFPQKLQLYLQLLISIQWVLKKLFTQYEPYQLKFNIWNQFISFLSTHSHQQQQFQVLLEVFNKIQRFQKHQDQQLIFSLKHTQILNLDNKRKRQFMKMGYSQQFLNKLALYFYHRYYSYYSNHQMLIFNRHQKHHAYIKYIQRYQRQFNLLQTTKAFNLIHFSLLRIMNQQNCIKQSNQLINFFVSSFSHFPQIYHFEIVLDTIAKNSQNMQSSIDFGVMVEQLQSVMAANQTSKPYSFFKAGLYLNMFEIYPYLATKINVDGQAGTKQSHFFHTFNKLQVNFANQHFYQLPHTHKELANRIELFRGFKLQLATPTQPVSKKPIYKSFYNQIYKFRGNSNLQDALIYQKQLDHIKCVRCKFYVANQISNQIIHKLEKLSQDDYFVAIFEFLVSRCLLWVKMKQTLLLMNDLMKMLFIYQKCRLIQTSYNISELLVSFLMKPSHRSFYLVELLSQPLVIVKVSYYLIIQDINYFRMLTADILSQLKRYYCSRPLFYFNNYKIEMIRLLHYIQEQQKFQNQIGLPQIFTNMQEVFSKRWEILGIFNQMQTPMALLLYATLVFNNDLFGDEAKKGILKRMAGLFNRASPTIKKICLRDYYLAYKQLFKPTLRKQKLIIKKCLPFNYLIKNSRYQMKFDLLQVYFTKHFIHHLKKKNKRLSKYFLKKRVKLKFNDQQTL